MPVNVDKPDTFKLATVETPAMFTSSNSDTPSTFIVPPIVVMPVIFTLTNVETPATFKSSSSDTPSTSKVPLASIAPAKVDTPDTFTLSISV